MDEAKKKVVGRPFEKGKSGNPKGRPKKGDSITDMLREAAENTDVKTSDGRKISRKRALAERIWQKALSQDDTRMQIYITDRLDGKATQPLESAPDENGERGPCVMVVQKRSLDEWQKRYEQPDAAHATAKKSSGARSQPKPKPSPAPRSNCSSAARKAAGKATSSSATTSRATKNGAKPGKA